MNWTVYGKYIYLWYIYHDLNSNLTNVEKFNYNTREQFEGAVLKYNLMFYTVKEIKPPKGDTLLIVLKSIQQKKEMRFRKRQ